MKTDTAINAFHLNDLDFASNYTSANDLEAILRTDSILDAVYDHDDALEEMNLVRMKATNLKMPTGVEFFVVGYEFVPVRCTYYIYHFYGTRLVKKIRGCTHFKVKRVNWVSGSFIFFFLILLDIASKH